MLTRAGFPVESLTEHSAAETRRPTLICFSHLRWDFVFQRPQHLMGRFADQMSVTFWEEPMEIQEGEVAFLRVREAEDFPHVRVVVPHVPRWFDESRREQALARLLEGYAAGLTRPLIAWYYTPMMLPFSRALDA